MRTSTAGIAFLKRHEGVVLRAYRCPAGVWTIGAGLTAGSGVVAPRAGMVITEAEADRLLAEALTRNYEPRVARAMPGARQHEFDGGASFDFNTGAVSRASWVASWKRRDWDGVADGLMRWTRGGGKVLPGLKRRRGEELVLMRDGDYGGPARPPRVPGGARIVLDLDADELLSVAEALASLGYQQTGRGVLISEAAVRAFQEAHGLTVDGIVGRATLSTLQRVIDSRSRAVAPAGAAAAGAAETGTGTVAQGVDLPAVDWLGPAVLVAGAIWLAWLAWQYRDAIAGAVHNRLPRVAAWLRSF